MLMIQNRLLTGSKLVGNQVLHTCGYDCRHNVHVMYMYIGLDISNELKLVIGYDCGLVERH